MEEIQTCCFHLSILGSWQEITPYKTQVLICIKHTNSRERVKGRGEKRVARNYTKKPTNMLREFYYQWKEKGLEGLQELAGQLKQRNAASTFVSETTY